MKRSMIWALALLMIVAGYFAVVLFTSGAREAGVPKGDAALPAPAAPARLQWAPDIAPPAPDLAELRGIEARAIDVTAKVRPAVVGVLSPSKAARPRPRHHTGGGSGIIVSADGLVLTQLHVSHMRDGVRDFTKPLHKPGEQATVFLADGRERKARLLGASLEYDLALLQLPGPGPYPFVPVKADVKAQTGDWVVKLGHPMGFRKDRPAPLRLGRVLASVPDAFATDCAIVLGDSGGPFFDLDGRLLGILHWNDAAVEGHINRLSVPCVIDPDVVQNAWMAIASSRIATLMDSMKKGEILPGGGMAWHTGLDRADRLAPDLWTQGRKLKEIVEPITQRSRACVVTILNGGTPVALGTVVDEDGLAVVMASTLPPRPHCRLPDGGVAELTVVGYDRSFDLAVVRVPMKLVRPVALADVEPVPAGTVVAAVGPDGDPRVIGVVSVTTRKLAGAEVPVYELPLQVRADRWWVYGQPSESGGGYTVLMAYGLAKVVGIKPGDQLVSVAGRPIATDDDIATAIREQRSGDVVALVVERGGKRQTLELPLLPDVSVNATNATWRSDDYPIALEYSPPVRTTECGGLLVDLSGRVLGVTVGRANTHAGWAIPADAIRTILRDAKAGKLATWPVR
jgi:S1-C subfamily serine protease